MRLRATLGTIGVCLLTSGCQLTWDITRNLAFETCLYTDTLKSKIHYTCMASKAWKEYSPEHPVQADSADFAKGFKQGYADFLEEGGSGGAPPAPPLRYWKLRYQNEQGRAATAMWSAGYQEGVAAAKASGARDYIIVPINKPPPSAAQAAGTPGSMPGTALPLPANAVPPGTPENELPQPRTIESEPRP